MKTKVFAMVSGGVDSSVAAARLKDAGFDVRAFYMQNWSYDRLSPQTAKVLKQQCGVEDDVKSAKEAMEYLKIPFEVVNFEKEYWNQVIEPFFKQYEEGLTPNPDVWCNQFIKFGVFLNWALKNGADLVATGHYSRLQRQAPISKSQLPNNELSEIKLLRGVDPSKDQSYFLSHVPPERLKYALFPIGHLYKSQVRAEAVARGLPNATKKDSQGICFVGKVQIQEFLKERLAEKRGPVIFKDGRQIGWHKGVWFYTIGQRHIDYQPTEPVVKGSDPEPLYVVDKDMATNTLFVGYNNISPPLWKKKLTATNVHWYQKTKGISPLVETEVRYHQNPCPKARLEIKDSKVVVNFLEPVRAIAKGQTVVFYKGSKILGAGIIES